MITTAIFDFSQVLLFPKDRTYHGELSPKYDSLKDTAGFSFFDNFELNVELFNFLKLHAQTTELYVFSNSSMLELPEIKHFLREAFNDVFSAREMKTSKRDPAAYTTLLARLGKQPSEVVFIDDMLPNLQAAEIAGLETIHFEKNSSLFEAWRSLGMS